MLYTSIPQPLGHEASFVGSGQHKMAGFHGFTRMMIGAEERGPCLASQSRKTLHGSYETCSHKGGPTSLSRLFVYHFGSVRICSTFLQIVGRRQGVGGLGPKTVGRIGGGSSVLLFIYWRWGELWHEKGWRSLVYTKLLLCWLRAKLPVFVKYFIGSAMLPPPPPAFLGSSQKG